MNHLLLQLNHKTESRTKKNIIKQDDNIKKEIEEERNESQVYFSKLNQYKFKSRRYI